MKEALATLLVASALLCVVLTTFTVIRKVRRDRNETRFLARRAGYEHVLIAGTADALTAELRKLRHVHDAQVDLLIALDVAWPTLDSTRRAVIHSSVVAARLDTSLARQLRSRDAVIRATAALLIGRLRLPNTSALVAPLVRDRDGDVRLAAVRALANLADAPAARVLIEALSTRRLEPERVIERLGNDWAVDTVLDVLERGGNGPHHVNGSDPEAVAWQPIRASLVRALGLAGNASAEPVLRRILRTGSVEERVGAARALGTVGSAMTEPDLEAALLDPEWPVRVQAARSLGLVGAEAAVPALAACLSDSAWWVRAAAAEALRQLGEPGLTALRTALDHPDQYARDRAREALVLHGLATERA